MPTAFVESPSRPNPAELPRIRWTRAECAVLEDSGLWELQHVELIDGEVINRMPKKRPHTNTLIQVQAWLVGVFGVQFVNPESPIDVAPEDNPTNEPVPDLIVLSRPSNEIRDANPRSEDLRLVVEVSDSTLRFDLTTKAELYARAGISDYWVFDIAGRRLIVHRDPRDGRYQAITAYSEEEAASPLAAPDRAFRIAEAY
jgi:Uma2 family endonuclease